MYGIIGSGFGLYGYLPAILKQHSPVALLDKSKEKLLSRDDVRGFYDSIRWMINRHDLIRSVDALVVSIPPFAQYDLLHDVLEQPGITRRVIEKPVAETPAKSSAMLERLI